MLASQDLIPVTLTKDADLDAREGSDGRGRYVCAVSKKQITSQPVVLLKK
jgi:hypothetical protein